MGARRSSIILLISVFCLTESDLRGLVHHGYFDGGAVREQEGQVLCVREEELLLPHAPEAHSVHQSHLCPWGPPGGVGLRVPGARELPTAAARQRPGVFCRDTERGSSEDCRASRFSRFKSEYNSQTSCAIYFLAGIIVIIDTYCVCTRKFHVFSRECYVCTR